jgi:hypothetical protein
VPAPASSSSYVFRLIAIIVVAAGAGTVALFFALRPYLARGPSTTLPRATSAPLDLAAELEKGRQALAARNPRQARHLLQAAVAGIPDRPASAQQRELMQLWRQADLLSDLLHLSLQEILQHATLVGDEEEWREEFAAHRNRALFLNDVIKRDSRGRPALLTYVVRSGKATARLAVEDLTLWSQVPLDDTPEVAFGARLASCEREEGGGWVFHFLPDSGVLLTEPAVVRLWLPEAKLKDVLKSQARWLDLEER